MRHAFSFPEHIRRALKNHIEKAVSEIDMNRYFQEPVYTTVLATKLAGVVYEQNDGYIKIESTVVNAQGRGAAEKWSGADLAITANISNGHRRIRKAILVQSKLGGINELKPSRMSDLQDQIWKMRQLTNSAKVMEIPEVNGQRRPRIISGQRILVGEPYRSYELSDYFVSRILTTLDGDTHQEFVDRVQDSGLTELRVIASFGLKQLITHGIKSKQPKVPVPVKVLA
jgi:hypothetical protein